jgi:hypothetical protein
LEPSVRLLSRPFVALVLVSGFAQGAASLPANVPESEWPKSVDSAVDYLMRELPASQRAEMLEMEESDLILTHFGLGLWIRNSFGLSRNRSLVEDACRGTGGVCGPEAVSRAIVRSLWERLRAEG